MQKFIMGTINPSESKDLVMCIILSPAFRLNLNN